MAKKVTGFIKLQIPGGKANPSPPIGPALGQRGVNIMELCKAYELPVKGECGGMAMCATCQCYLESDTELEAQSDAELDMLDQAFFVKANSRLGCQIHLSEEIDGIVLRLAPEQD